MRDKVEREHTMQPIKLMMHALLYFLARWHIKESGVRVTITFPDRHTAYCAWDGLKIDAAPLQETLPRFEVERAEDMRCTFLGVPLEFVHEPEHIDPRCDSRPKVTIS